MRGAYIAKTVMLVWIAVVSLAAINWVCDNADRLDALEHRVMVLEDRYTENQTQMDEFLLQLDEFLGTAVLNTKNP